MRRLALLAAAAAVCLALPRSAIARPGFNFGMTSEDLVLLVDQSNVLVLSTPTKVNGKQIHLKVEKVLRGQDEVGQTKEFVVDALSVVELPKESIFFLSTGIKNPPRTIGLDAARLAFVEELAGLPIKDPEHPLRHGRLEFFLKYLEHEREALAVSAATHFANHIFSDLPALKGKLPVDKLRAWIQDDHVRMVQRNTYLRLLAVVGDPADAPIARKFVMDDPWQLQARRDFAIGCYVALGGEPALAYVEETWLPPKKVKFEQLNVALIALRIAAESSDRIPRERYARAFRRVLDRPEIADLVIPDLRRWQDWEPHDRMVGIFKQDSEGGLIRPKVVEYLLACPEPAAKEHLQTLSKIDPELVRRLTAAWRFEQERKAPAEKDAKKESK